MFLYTIEVKLVIIKSILSSVYDGTSPGKPLKITKKYIRKKVIGLGSICFPHIKAAIWNRGEKTLKTQKTSK